MRPAHAPLIAALLGTASAASDLIVVKETTLAPTRVAYLIGSNTRQIQGTEQLAAKGDARAKLVAGYIKILGHGHPTDPAKAIAYFSDPKLSRTPAALEGLTRAYLLRGNTFNPQKSYAAAERYAALHPDGLAIKGLFKTQGIGTRKDVKGGLRDIEDALNKGSGEADYLTAIQYFTGNLRKKNFSKGDIYLSSALHKENANALTFKGDALIGAKYGYRRNVKQGYVMLAAGAARGNISAPLLIAKWRAEPPSGYKPQPEIALETAKHCGDGGNGGCNYLAAKLQIKLGGKYTDPSIRSRLRQAALRGHTGATAYYFFKGASLKDATDYALLLYAQKNKVVASETFKQLSARATPAMKQKAPSILKSIEMYAKQGQVLQ